MSEYQYYEFLAIDHRLGEADRKALRALSTRARITTTSFTNSYDWGSFKGDPAELMERWFDLHLYLANWGTRRLMFRLPRQLVDRRRLDHCLRGVEEARLRATDAYLILDIERDELPDEDGTEDGSGWLAALAPLRAEVLAGDLRLFYLLWLMAVARGAVAPDATEPLSGIGPMTGALDAFVDFFAIDADLVAAAAESGAGTAKAASSGDVRRIVAALPDRDRTDLLVRLAEGDPHVAFELRALVQDRLASEGSATGPATPPRTAGALRARADAIRQARERAEAETRAAHRKQQAGQEAQARRARLNALFQRGEAVWREIEAEIERRNASSYDKAAGLLHDLCALAGERGTSTEFLARLQAIRQRHSGKWRFIERLRTLA